MLRIIKKVIITLIIITAIIFTVKVFAESYSGNDIMAIATELADQIEAAGNIVPATIQIRATSTTINTTDALYLMAKWLELYERKNTVPDSVPFMAIQKPANPGSGVTKGQIDAEYLFKAGRDVAAILEQNPEIPSNFKVIHTDSNIQSEQDIDSYNLIFIFARAIRGVASKNTMLDTVVVEEVTPADEIANQEFTLSGGYFAYKQIYNRPTPTSTPPYDTNEYALKLGLNYSNPSTNIYCPLYIGWDTTKPVKVQSDSSDRYDFRTKFSNSVLRYTNNYSSFNGMPADPFNVIVKAWNPFADNDDAEFYRLNTKLIGEDIQLQSIRTTANQYALFATTEDFGNYKFNLAYYDRERYSDHTENARNCIAWLAGPMPGLSGKASLGYMASTSRYDSSTDYITGLTGTGSGYKIALKEVGLGIFTIDATHLYTDPHCTSVWSTSTQNFDFAGTNRLYNYINVSSYLTVLGQNTKVSLGGSNEINHYGTNYRPNLANHGPNEQEIVKLLVELEPSSTFKYHISGQTSDAYVKNLDSTTILNGRITSGSNLEGKNDQLEFGFQKMFGETRLIMNADYNNGYSYLFDYLNKDKSFRGMFEAPNTSVYFKLDNPSLAVVPTLAGFYQDIKDVGPANIRAFGKLKGTINPYLSINIAYLWCSHSTITYFDGDYQFVGFTNNFGNTTFDTSYRIFPHNALTSSSPPSNRFYFKWTQKFRAGLLSLIYGYNPSENDKGTGGYDSFDHNSIEDNKPWEVLMGSTVTPTDPAYILKWDFQF